MVHRATVPFVRQAVACLFAAAAFSGLEATAQVTPGTVLSHMKVTEDLGNFLGELEKEDRFGSSLAFIGDLDNDGIPDLAVGARGDDELGTNRGSVWVLRLNASSTVKSFTEINDQFGGFGAGLSDNDEFGISLAPVGDLDGDGVPDLAVGAHRDDDGGTDRGAVWILFLNSTGSVKSRAKISDTQGGFTGVLDNSDNFGGSLAGLGDIDGDGVDDLAVGAPRDDDGGTDRGALWILLLNANGSVKGHTKISDTARNFTGTLDNSDNFGSSVAAVGDVDGDGVGDLAVGAKGDDDGSSSRGAAWILFMNADETVKGHAKISATSGGFTGTLGTSDLFGHSMAAVGDLDSNGVPDLAVGAPGDDDGGSGRGAVWVLFLNGNGSVFSHRKYSETQGGFLGSLEDQDEFGYSVAAADINNNGVVDLVAGADLDDDCNDNYGATWTLFLDTQPNAWVDLGGASPGSNGIPTLTCNSSLATGASLNMKLENVVPSGFVMGWVGLVSTPLDALGGTVYAFPFLNQFIFPINSAGELLVATTWPPGAPGNTDVYLQFLCQDQALPDKLSLSNGMQGTTP